MTKILRVDDDVHEFIKNMADLDNRKISAFVNKVFKELKDGHAINAGTILNYDSNTDIRKRLKTDYIPVEYMDDGTKKMTIGL